MTEENGKVLAGCVKTTESGAIRLSTECRLEIGDHLEVVGVKDALKIESIRLKGKPIKRATKLGIVVDLEVNGPISRIARGTQIFLLPEAVGG